MDVRDDLKRLIDDVLDGDPRTSLIALRRLIDDELPWIERKVVGAARLAGWNWAIIGRLLGRSRATVRERFGPMTLTMRPPQQRITDQERGMREIVAEIQRRRAYDADDDPVAW